MSATPLRLGLIGAGIVAAGPYRKALERLPIIKTAGVFDPGRRIATAWPRSETPITTNSRLLDQNAGTHYRIFTPADIPISSTASIRRDTCQSRLAPDWG